MKSPTGARIHVFPDQAALVEAAARELTARAEAAVLARGVFTLAISGGKSPEPLYRRLAESPWRDAPAWAQTKLFFSDERPVPPEHPDSNWRLAWESWLRDGPIPLGQLFRMHGEADNLAQAARDYSNLLTHEVASGPSAFPALDLVLLGMGEDGHTASLFPKTAALDETLRVVAVNEVPQLATRRLTLTFPALDAAAEAWFLVTGAAKAHRVAQCLGFQSGGETLPAALVHPQGGNVHWWLDQPAAAELPPETGRFS